MNAVNGRGDVRSYLCRRELQNVGEILSFWCAEIFLLFEPPFELVDLPLIEQNPPFTLL